MSAMPTLVLAPTGRWRYAKHAPHANSRSNALLRHDAHVWHVPLLVAPSA